MPVVPNINPISKFTSDLSGRLCVRQTQDGFITVGVLHTPKGFMPEETEAFFMAFTPRGMTLVAERAPHLNEAPEYGFAIEQMSELTPMRNWQDGEHMGGYLHTFRFSKVFDGPHSHGFQVVSCSKRDPFSACDGIAKDNFQSEPHYLVDIAAGAVTYSTETQSIGRMRGTALSQLFTNFPIWPDADNKLHTLPNLTQYGQQKMAQLQSINRDHLLGVITPEDAGDQRRKLNEFSSGKMADDGYLKYLGIITNFRLNERHITPVPMGQVNEPIQKAALDHIVSSMPEIAFAKNLTGLENQLDSDAFYARLCEITGAHWQPFFPYQESPVTGLKMGFDPAHLDLAVAQGIPGLSSPHSDPLLALNQMALECIESGDPACAANFTRATLLSPNDFLAHEPQIKAAHASYTQALAQAPVAVPEKPQAPSPSKDGPSPF